MPLMSALVDVRKTADLIKRNQLPTALATAQEAVALAPDSAITQINLADTLAAQGQWGAALEHYQQVGKLAQTIQPELEDEDLVPRSKAGAKAAQNHLGH